MNITNLAPGKAAHIAADPGRVYRVMTQLAQSLWPWSEKRLAVMVGCLAALDYISTIAFLKLSGSRGAYEAGILASGALERGGLVGLLLNDIAAVGLLLLFAGGIRNSCRNNPEFRWFSRIAFVLVLLPYSVTAAAAIANNIVIAFL